MPKETADAIALVMIDLALPSSVIGLVVGAGLYLWFHVARLTREDLPHWFYPLVGVCGVALFPGLMYVIAIVAIELLGLRD